MTSMRMLRPASWLLAMAVLGGCASAPPPRTVVATPLPPANQTRPVDNGGSIGVDRPVARPAPTAVSPVIGGTTAQRIVQVALRENGYWYQPFIDINGGLRSQHTTEAERVRLTDGTESWAKVVTYWLNSGTLFDMIDSGIAGATACQYASISSTRSECRSFLLDNPWSAAFISYVMVQAQVPSFHTSPAHIDYIRDAFNGTGPYAAMDPATTTPQPGDLLCYVRNTAAIVGYEGLRAAFAANPRLRQAAHCDVVVTVSPAQQRMESVGGNVLNGVTLRKLQLDARGIPILPRPASFSNDGDDDASGEIGCSPATEGLCSLNRQNWAALLKLRVP